MSFCPTCQADFPANWKRCPTDEAELLPSRYVGKYRIDAVIGVGGMGAVYKALNPDTRAPVAIKLMHPDASAVDSARARFQREAAAIAALRTRHLVRVYDFGATDDGTLYLVMEYLLGHNLRPEIDSVDTTMAVQRINLVMDGALRGLGAAHRAGIVHRDLKPENIYLADTEDGEVAKVLDFGIARVQSTSQHSALTQEGALMGTPAYMAPEQVSGKRGAIDAHTDVYAMGVIAYEMFTGDTPFGAESLTEILGRVLERSFRPLGEVRPELPPAIIELVDTAMHEHPAQRFCDANELRDAWLTAYRSFDPATRDATVPEFIGDPAASVSRLGTAPTARPDTGTSIAPVVIASRPTELAPSPATYGRSIAVAAVLALAGAGLGGYLMLAGDTGSERNGPARASDAAMPVAILHDADAGLTVTHVPTIPDGMVRLSGGTFEVGVDPDEYGGFKDMEPRHNVTVGPFLIDKHEMTVAKHRAALLEGGRTTPPPSRDSTASTTMPARELSWEDAAAACKGLGKRLPTENEWSFAASRSPLDPARARMRSAGVRGPAPVGSHAGDCTRDGVCDLLGNVSEWTADPWRSRNGTVAADLRTVRGASYRVAPTAKWYATIHARVKLASTQRDAEVGYRCARDLDQ